MVGAFWVLLALSDESRLGNIWMGNSADRRQAGLEAGRGGKYLWPKLRANYQTGRRQNGGAQ